MRSEDFFSGEYDAVDLAICVTRGTCKDRALWRKYLRNGSIDECGKQLGRRARQRRILPPVEAQPAQEGGGAMTHRCSDRRLRRLVKELLIALEDPAAGIVFDDYDLRYRERERIREKNSSECFYRDKTPFESGAAALLKEVAYDLDGPEEEPQWLVLWRRRRRLLTKKQRAVLDALAIDWRNYPAARIAGVDHKTVDCCKKIFKVHFAQCFRAWDEDSAF